MTHATPDLDGIEARAKGTIARSLVGTQEHYDALDKLALISYARTLLARAEQAEGETLRLAGMLGEEHAERESLLAVTSRLRAALHCYSDSFDDNGEIARAALALDSAKEGSR